MFYLRNISLIFLFAIVSSNTLSAQFDNYIGDIIPPTPNAGALGKYGEIPVSYNIGNPNISIPVYNLTEGGISLPISLSYHTSGIKVSEMASWVGLGWSLNAGGIITRSIRGAQDEGSNVGSSVRGYYFDSTPLDPTDPDYINEFTNATDGIIDTEADTYFFNIGGYSGRFYFDRDKNVQIIPQQDIKIEVFYDINANPNRFTYWTITTPDGTKYFFGDDSYDGNWEDDAIEASTSYRGDLVGGEPYKININSWYLVKIESPNGQFSIDLEYEFENYRYSNLGSSSAYVVGDCNTLGSLNYLAHTDQIITEVRGVRLSKAIASQSNQSIMFHSNIAREDLDNWGDIVNMNLRLNADNSAPISTQYQAKRLDEIEILGVDGNCTKKFKFNYDYFLSNSAGFSSQEGSWLDQSRIPDGVYPDRKRLRLLSFSEKSCDNLIELSHSFEYHNPTEMPRRKSHGQDHWGYNNGVTSNKNLFSRFKFFSFSAAEPTIDCLDALNFGNREVDESKTKAGILTKVTYPTAGSTTIDYESHDHYATRMIASTNLLFTVTNCNGPFACSIDCGNGVQGNTVVPFAGELNFNLDINRIQNDPNTCTYTSSGIIEAQLFCYETNSPINDPTRNQIRDEFVLQESQDYYSKCYENNSSLIQDLTRGVDYTFEIRILNGGYAHMDINFKQQTVNTITDNYLIGGLRVANITSKTSNSDPKPIVKQFKYVEDFGSTQSSGKLVAQVSYLQKAVNDNIYIVNSSSVGGNEQCYEGGFIPYRLTNNSIVPLASSQGSHVVYRRTEVKYLGESNDLGESEYIYNIDYTPDFRIVSNNYHEALPLFNDFSVPPENALPLLMGTLEKESHYNEENNSKTLTSQTINDYTLDNEGISSFYFYSKLRICNCEETQAGLLQCTTTFGSNPYYAFNRASYTLNTGAVLLKSTTSTTDGVSTITDYKYDQEYNHLFPIETTTTNSDNITYTTRNKYPLDYQNPINGIGPAIGLKNLIDRHIIASPIESTQYVKLPNRPEQVLSSTLTEYKNSGFPYPDKTWRTEYERAIIGSEFTPSYIGNNSSTLFKDNDYQCHGQALPQMTYNNYDNFGNPLEIQQTFDQAVAMTWSHDGIGVTSITKNALQEEVAFTSFEYSTDENNPTDFVEDGNWNYQIQGITSGAYYTLNGGFLYNPNNRIVYTNTNVPLGKYIISFWAKNDSGTGQAADIIHVSLKLSGKKTICSNLR